MPPESIEFDESFFQEIESFRKSTLTSRKDFYSKLGVSKDVLFVARKSGRISIRILKKLKDGFKKELN